MAQARSPDTGALMFGGVLCLVAYVVTGLIIRRTDWPAAQFGASFLAGMTIVVVTGLMSALIPPVPQDSRDPYQVGLNLALLVLMLISTLAAGACMSIYWRDLGPTSRHGQNHQGATSARATQRVPHRRLGVLDGSALWQLL
jgi:hypothetical protein